MIGPEVGALLESPAALVVGTVDEARMPDATRAWGLKVMPDRTSARVLLSSTAAVAIENLRHTKSIALTATDFRTFESVQMKGRAILVEPANDDDVDAFERFCEAIVRRLHEVDGTPMDLIRRMRPPGVVACVVEVDELYNQTPGPTAGQRLTPGAV